MSHKSLFLLFVTLVAEGGATKRVVRVLGKLVPLCLNNSMPFLILIFPSSEPEISPFLLNFLLLGVLIQFVHLLHRICSSTQNLEVIEKREQSLGILVWMFFFLTSTNTDATFQKKSRY